MSSIATRTFQGISTGLMEIDHQLGGGLPWGCVALVEGKHGSGKSVLCQHLTHSALQTSSVAFYTSETGSPSLLSQMASLRLDVMDHFLLDRLRIFPLELTDLYPDADELLQVLVEHIAALPPEFQFIVVDSLTPFLPRCSRSTILDFSIECRQLCSQNKAIILTLDPRPAIASMVTQIYPWCDIHLNLQMEAITVERVVKALRVLKSSGGKSRNPAEKVHFEVQEGLGINILRPKLGYP